MNLGGGINPQTTAIIHFINDFYMSTYTHEQIQYYPCFIVTIIPSWAFLCEGDKGGVTVRQSIGSRISTWLGRASNALFSGESKIYNTWSLPLKCCSQSGGETTLTKWTDSREDTGVNWVVSTQDIETELCLEYSGRFSLTQQWRIGEDQISKSRKRKQYC